MLNKATRTLELPQDEKQTESLQESDKSLHAVLIVGYEIDAQNRIVTYICQNSWGDDNSNGVFKITSSYLNKYGASVTYVNY